MTAEQEEEFHKNNPNIRKLAASEITLEKIYEETAKDTPDNYENIRGPRPWEDNSDFNSQIEELEEKSRNKRKIRTIKDKKLAYGL